MKFFLFVFVFNAALFYAQENGQQYDTLNYQTDDIIVTGTRVAKKIIDIPYPVARIDKATFKYLPKGAVNQVIEDVPGVLFQSRYGNHDVRISMRGFGSRSNSGIRGVRILLDGIPESEPDGQTRIEAIDFNSIGSVEIVKGNSSSLYTNAPGGVINFISDVDIRKSSVNLFNEYGSFGYRRNGFKALVNGDNYRLMATYTYHNYKGFRQHSEDYWNIFNSAFETSPAKNLNLQVLGYFADGLIRLPGSLQLAEYKADPYQGAKTEKDYDYRRVSKKGRIAVRFDGFFDSERKNEFEATAYGTIKYFERAQKTFRIMNRYGIGATFRYINKSEIAGLDNEFSVGGDLFYQAGPVEEYGNIAGAKADGVVSLVDEAISNSGYYIQNSLELYDKKFYLLVTGRYDDVLFDQKDQDLGSRSITRDFNAFTPKAALNYKLLPNLSVYTSAGYSFDSPAGNEMDNFPTSSNPGIMLNPDLKPQKSLNYEAGIKGNILTPDLPVIKNSMFELTFFRSTIRDEIVPFEVFGSVYYRNAAETVRNGIELGGNFLTGFGTHFVINYTYSGFKYDSYNALALSLDTSGNVIETAQDYSGKEVPSVPRHNFSFSINYDYSITAEFSAYTKLRYNYMDGMYTNDANSENAPSYNLVNFNLGLNYDFGPFNIVLSGGVQNLTNVKYVGFININSTSNRFYEAGAPRNYFGSLNLSYTI